MKTTGRKLLAGILLLSSLSALAGQGREGGNHLIAKENLDNAAYKRMHNEIKTMIETGNIKKRMAYIIKQVRPHKLEQFNFTKKEFINDLEASTYKIANNAAKEKCVDSQGVEKFATASMNQKGGEICFDLSKIYEKKHLITHQEFLAVVFHEHLHHFGYADKDHKKGTYLATLMTYLPWNIVQGDCNDNLKNGRDSFNYQIYADDFGADNFENNEAWYLKDFKRKAIKSIEHIYEFSSCDPKAMKLKIKCQEAFVTINNGFKSSDFICKAETHEGYMYLTMDMLGFMNVNFMRWD